MSCKVHPENKIELCERLYASSHDDGEVLGSDTMVKVTNEPTEVFTTSCTSSPRGNNKGPIRKPPGQDISEPIAMLAMI